VSFTPPPASAAALSNDSPDFSRRAELDEALALHVVDRVRANLVAHVGEEGLVGGKRLLPEKHHGAPGGRNPLGIETVRVKPEGCRRDLARSAKFRGPRITGERCEARRLQLVRRKECVERGAPSDLALIKGVREVGGRLDRAPARALALERRAHLRLDGLEIGRRVGLDGGGLRRRGPWELSRVGVIVFPDLGIRRGVLRRELSTGKVDVIHRDARRYGVSE
jgi:hypothetical protein